MRGRNVIAATTVAVVLLAMAWVLVPYTDSHVRCSSAAKMAAHGQAALFFDKRTAPVATGGEAVAGYFFLPQSVHRRLVLACRDSSRVRLATSAAVAVIAVVGMEIGFRLLRRRRTDPLVE